MVSRHPDFHRNQAKKGLQTGRHVIVCGIPGSGNKLIMAHLKRANIFGQHDVNKVSLQHGYSEKDGGCIPLAEKIVQAGYAVVPVRQELSCRLSNERHGRKWVFGDPNYLVHHAAEIDLAFRAGARVVRVNLEDIVDDPDSLNLALGMIGVASRPWPADGDGPKGPPRHDLVDADRYIPGLTAVKKPAVRVELARATNDPQFKDRI